jgi:hypothetical protein
VGGSRFGSREGDRVRLTGILNGGQRLGQSSPRETRRDKVASNRAPFLLCVVARVLAQDALGHTVADTHYLVLFLTFEVMVPGVMAASTAVAPRRGPSALGRGVVMPDFMAPGALNK